MPPSPPCSPPCSSPPDFSSDPNTLPNTTTRICTDWRAACQKNQPIPIVDPSKSMRFVSSPFASHRTIITDTHIFTASKILLHATPSTSAAPAPSPGARCVPLVASQHSLATALTSSFPHLPPSSSPIYINSRLPKSKRCVGVPRLVSFNDLERGRLGRVADEHTTSRSRSNQRRSIPPVLRLCTESTSLSSTSVTRSRTARPARTRPAAVRAPLSRPCCNLLTCPPRRLQTATSARADPRAAEQTAPSTTSNTSVLRACARSSAGSD